MTEIVVAIVGSRDFTDEKLLFDKVDKLRAKLLRQGIKIVKIVSGGATGADWYAEQYAKRRGLAFQEFPADWKKYLKRAGYIRNRQIVEAADLVIAFQINNSKGTQHSIDISDELGKPYRVIKIKRP